MFFCCLRDEGVEQTLSKFHPTSGNSPLVCQWPSSGFVLMLSGRMDGALGCLFIGSDRNRVVVAGCLQIFHALPAYRRPWWWILGRILDALCNRLSDFLIWENGFPVLTSDGCL